MYLPILQNTENEDSRQVPTSNANLNGTCLKKPCIESLSLRFADILIRSLVQGASVFHVITWCSVLVALTNRTACTCFGVVMHLLFLFFVGVSAIEVAVFL
jgi:hypothetical protein